MLANEILLNLSHTLTDDTHATGQEITTGTQGTCVHRCASALVL